MADDAMNQTGGPGAAAFGDVPTIGHRVIPPPGYGPAPMPTGPVAPPTAAHVPVAQFPVPNAAPAYPTTIGGPPPTSPPGGGRSGSSMVLLVVAGVLGLVVTATALLVVLSATRSSDDDQASPTTAITTAPAPTSPTSTVDPAPPAPAPAPVPLPTPAPAGPTVGAASGSGELRGRSEVAYGSYVAVLWSEVIDSGSEARASDARSTKGGSFRVPTAVVYGDDFRTLRDGTIAVVYDGGFASLADAAQWCWDRGVRDADSCFGVGLNDDYGVEDRDGTGRMYVSELDR